MLTSEDLEQIRIIINGELEPIRQELIYLRRDVNQIKDEITKIWKEIAKIKKDISRLTKITRKLKADLDVTIRLFDNDIIDSQHRIDRLEQLVVQDALPQNSS